MIIGILFVFVGVISSIAYGTARRMMRMNVEKEPFSGWDLLLIVLGIIILFFGFVI